MVVACTINTENNSCGPPIPCSTHVHTNNIKSSTRPHGTTRTQTNHSINQLIYSMFTIYRSVLSTLARMGNSVSTPTPNRALNRPINASITCTATSRAVLLASGVLATDWMASVSSLTWSVGLRTMVNRDEKSSMLLGSMPVWVGDVGRCWWCGCIQTIGMRWRM